MRHALRGLLLMIVLWPAITFAESTFSAPAGAPSSSNGFSIPAGAANNGPVISDSGFSVPSGAATNALVRGEVVRVEGDTYVIRDISGRELRLQPTKDAHIEYLPRSGDWVEAQLSNGRASSITKGSASPGSTPAGPK
jgi:uncharacterized protein YdeI (BOF family)